MIGILHGAGYQITSDHNKADISLVNTCTFIEGSTNESLDVLTELADQGQKLIITGCMAQRYKGDLFEGLPEAQAVVGTGNVKDILSVVKEVTRNINSGKDSKIIKVDEVPMSVAGADTPRIHTQIGPSVYLKIAEGCDHRCAFCIIPHLRGDMKSRSIEDIVKEAQTLVASGAKEIVLVSQDSTAYGTDIYKRRALADLLRALAEKSGAPWIRLMYAYPTEMDREMLEVIAAYDNIVKYIDIPLQHASRKVLLSMRRPPTVRDTVELIRSVIPSACIRTTFISGFPGETDADHQELFDFIQESRFDRVGVFTYSQEEGTPAGSFDEQVDAELKTARRDQLMQLQQQISLEKNQDYLGATLKVLVEHLEELPDGSYRAVARSFRDAPEIDGQVYINLANDEIHPAPGEFIDITIDACDEYDLFGVFKSV
jgi:ribosomal protein S12 methylthiotransferase